MTSRPSCNIRGWLSIVDQIILRIGASLKKNQCFNVRERVYRSLIKKLIFSKDRLIDKELINERNGNFPEIVLYVLLSASGRNIALAWTSYITPRNADVFWTFMTWFAFKLKISISRTTTSIAQRNIDSRWKKVRFSKDICVTRRSFPKKSQSTINALNFYIDILVMSKTKSDFCENRLSACKRKIVKLWSEQELCWLTFQRLRRLDEYIVCRLEWNNPWNKTWNSWIILHDFDGNKY